MPRPVESSSSPPSSQGVGSGSSDAWSQRTSLPRPPAPPATRSCRDGIEKMSLTVSMDKRSKDSAAPRARRLASLYGGSRAADRIETMGSTYERAGVSLGKAGDVVERLRGAVESTRTAGVVGAVGGFAGLFALDGTRLLAASTDGV